MRVTAEQFIEKTIETIETYGWVQKDLGSKTQGFCIIGAMEYSYNQLKPSLDTYLEVFRAVNHVTGGSPHTYNDAPKRNRNQVVTALRKASKLVNAS